jgi:regulator of ribonuclease activity A
MRFRTTEICDMFPDFLQISEPVFSDYGEETMMHGPIVTLKVFEDNVLVRKVLEEPGMRRVLVVDGGGSMRCALLGDKLATIAKENSWSGVLINGCIRDSAVISKIGISIKALGVHPLRSIKRGFGDRDIIVRFAGVNFVPGHYLYADEDGLLVVENQLF